MKNKYFILAVIMLIVGAGVTGCDKNRENTQKDVEQANKEMMDEQAQFDKDWQQFRNDAELKINANEKKIDDLKLAMRTTSAKFKTKYENQVLTLEQKNIELRKKLNNYKYEGKDNWEIFKVEFNQEVDTVITAINDIFSKKD
jgi:hypothetical protein